MRSLDLCRSAVSIGATAALLAACGGSPPIGALGAMAQRHSVTPHTEHGTSRMLPEAKSDDLLYVSTTGGDVYAYSWTKHKLVGTLTGFGYAFGLCIDRDQNVWITSESESSVFRVTEYAHGGTKPLRTVIDNAGTGIACGADPNSDTLAVVNSSGPGSSNSNVMLFSTTNGSALVVYTDANIPYMNSAGFDSSGNLLVVGENESLDGQIAELKKNAAHLTDIPLNKKIEGLGGGVQWDAPYWVIGAGLYSAAYQVSVNSSQGTLVNQINLLNQASTEIAVYGSTLIGGSSNDGQVYYYPYPKGGSPSVTIDVTEPAGTGVSLASRAASSPFTRPHRLRQLPG